MMNKPTVLLKASVSAMLAGFAFSASAVEPVYYDHGMYDARTGTFSDQSEFVGISSEFGRFPTGIVRLAYDHANAPAGTTAEEVIAVLEAAFAQIEGICGIDFQFLGQVTSSPADENDEIVDIDWMTEESSTLATAGPVTSFSDATTTALGYPPFVSGGLSFNTKFGDPTVDTTVHELMHLIGLGHSESPISIMRPATSRYDLPQADDIAALQAIYGPPDVLVVPRLTINLNQEASSNTLAIDTLNSNFIHQTSDSTDAIQTLSSGSADDAIFLELRHEGASTDPVFELFITDPNGHTNRRTADFDPANAGISPFIDTYEILAEIPGNWTVTVGNAGKQLAQFTLPVDGPKIPHNRNPSASLTWTRLASNRFNFSISASDPEGDNLTYKYYIPGQGEVTDAGTSVDITATGPDPVIAYAAVIDDGIKRRSTVAPQTPFGALMSRYIVMPAEENIATYYVQDKILHIPSLDIGGQVLSVNLKLTALPGIEFKLLEYDVVTNFSGTAGATLDLSTGALNMPRVILSDNGSNSEVQNIGFKLVPDSQPIRFGI